MCVGGVNTMGGRVRVSCRSGGVVVLKASSYHATSEALVGSGLSRDARQTPRAATQEAGLALQSVW